MGPIELCLEQFGDFAAERVNPGTEARDRAGTPIPRALFQEAAERGFLSMALPAEIGGGGADPVVWGAALEQVGYRCHDLSFPLVTSLYVAVASTICESGRPHLIDRYARSLVHGERFVAFAYSEQRDPFHFRSTLVRAGGGYILNGWKCMVTGGMMADAFMTYARNETGDLSVVLVERSDDGVEVAPIDTMGARAAGLANLELRQVPIPAARVLVLSDGLSHVQRFLNQRRVVLVTSLLGRMRAILESCIERLNRTIRYGNPLTQMPNVQATLGRMCIAVETSRAVVYDALERLRGGRYDPVWEPAFCVAKYHLTQQALAVGRDALRVLGGQGYLSSLPFERFLRDATGMVAGAGAQDILEVDLGVRCVSDWQRRAAEEGSP